MNLFFIRLIKEFDREIKDEDSRNPPDVSKKLNDEKQSMVKFVRLLYFLLLFTLFFGVLADQGAEFICGVKKDVSPFCDLIFLRFYHPKCSFHIFTFFYNIYGFLLKSRYQSTLGNKRVELFDMGAGASEPMADDNTRVASGEIRL